MIRLFALLFFSLPYLAPSRFSNRNGRRVHICTVTCELSHKTSGVVCEFCKKPPGRAGTLLDHHENNVEREVMMMRTHLIPACNTAHREWEWSDITRISTTTTTTTTATAPTTATL